MLLPLKDIFWGMDTALDEAEKAYQAGEVPVGATLLDEKGKVIVKTHNLKEKTKDPCAHAEILAIREATIAMGDWRLNQLTLIVTMEPCLMCMGALWQARIGHLVFGTYDPKGGALSLGLMVHQDKRLNHRFGVMGGIQHFRCSRLLSTFFKEKRREYKFKRT